MAEQVILPPQLSPHVNVALSKSNEAAAVESMTAVILKTFIGFPEVPNRVTGDRYALAIFDAEVIDEPFHQVIFENVTILRNVAVFDLLNTFSVNVTSPLKPTPPLTSSL